jgi:hypothetical protein
MGKSYMTHFFSWYVSHSITFWYGRRGRSYFFFAIIKNSGTLSVKRSSPDRGLKKRCKGRHWRGIGYGWRVVSLYDHSIVEILFEGNGHSRTVHNFRAAQRSQFLSDRLFEPSQTVNSTQIDGFTHFPVASARNSAMID